MSNGTDVQQRDFSLASTKLIARGRPGLLGFWRRRATRFSSRLGLKGNFVLEMDRAHAQSRRTIAVLSPDYISSRFTAPEWAARFAQDATSEHDLLLPVRVRSYNLEGLLAQIVYVDLVGCSEEHRTS